MEVGDFEETLLQAVKVFTDRYKMEDFLESIDPYDDLESDGFGKCYITSLNFKGSFTGEIWFIASDQVVSSSMPIEELVEYNLEMKDWSLEIANQIAGIFITDLNKGEYNLELGIPEIRVVDNVVDFYKDGRKSLTVKHDIANSHSLSVLLSIDDVKESA